MLHVPSSFFWTFVIRIPTVFELLEARFFLVEGLEIEAEDGTRKHYAHPCFGIEFWFWMWL